VSPSPSPNGSNGSTASRRCRRGGAGERAAGGAGLRAAARRLLLRRTACRIVYRRRLDPSRAATTTHAKVEGAGTIASPHTAVPLNGPTIAIVVGLERAILFNEPPVSVLGTLIRSESLPSS